MVVFMVASLDNRYDVITFDYSNIQFEIGYLVLITLLLHHTTVHIFLQSPFHPISNLFINKIQYKYSGAVINRN